MTLRLVDLEKKVTLEEVERVLSRNFEEVSYEESHTYYLGELGYMDLECPNNPFDIDLEHILKELLEGAE